MTSLTKVLARHCFLGQKVKSQAHHYYK